MTISDIHQECNYEASLLADQNQCLQAEIERLRDFITHISVTVHAPEENYTDKRRIDDLESAFLEYGINDLMWEWTSHSKPAETSSQAPHTKGE
jgi:hypothetical protein